MRSSFASLFFFNDTATTEIYTLSLHDALPISHDPYQGGETGDGDGAGDTAAERLDGVCHRLHGARRRQDHPVAAPAPVGGRGHRLRGGEEHARARSEEHTSELQSRLHLVCRLLLEKKK